MLLLAEVMGTYFIAQVLQVRMTIPEARRCVCTRVAMQLGQLMCDGRRLAVTP